MAACLVAGSAVFAPVDRAGAATSDPAPLWQAYPLDEAPTGGTAPTADRSGRRRGPEVSSSITPSQLGGGGVPWLVLVLGAASTAVFVAVAVDLRRGTLLSRRRTAYFPDRQPPVPATSRRRPARAAPTRAAGDALPQAPGRAGGRPVPPRLLSPGDPRSHTPPTRAARADQAAGAPPEASPRAESPVPVPSGGAGGAPARRPRARGGPVCQVRWLSRGRGMCFCAVIVEEDGAERTFATSPPVPWPGSGPPDESPEARAALRQLSKAVRESGWRPMRARGTDFDEQRWYARRFRPIVEPPDGTDAATDEGRPRAAGGGTAA